MKVPGIIASGLLAILLFGLQWALSHIGEFSIPSEYLTIVTGLLGVAIAAVAKLVQERTAKEPDATARGMDEPVRDSYWARVLYK